MSRTIACVIVVGAMVLSIAPAYADVGDQLVKLLPEDGEGSGWFGWRVATSGATAIIGAPVGFASAAAYLFDISDPTNPIQLARLLPEDAQPAVWFGWSVAISGATAIVGDNCGNDNDSFSGSAYLFDISDPTDPQQIAKLLADDGAEYDWFATSVAISGTTVVVGAMRDDDNGTDSGSAYLFDTTTGAQLAKFLPEDGRAYDEFGWSAAISGTTAIVGAPLENDDDKGLIDSGSAYLFDISDPTDWIQIAKFTADDGAGGDWFGHSVALSGITAIVGAHGDDDNGTESGSAYLFDADAASTCPPADLDGDGTVGAGDLAALLGSWGPCKGCQMDFNDDGVVGPGDLATLLAAWGPCL